MSDSDVSRPTHNKHRVLPIHILEIMTKCVHLHYVKEIKVKNRYVFEVNKVLTDTIVGRSV